MVVNGDSESDCNHFADGNFLDDDLDVLDFNTISVCLLCRDAMGFYNGTVISFLIRKGSNLYLLEIGPGSSPDRTSFCIVLSVPVILVYYGQCASLVMHI